MARNRFSIRPSLSYQPQEQTRIDLVITAEHNRDSGTQFKSALYPPTGGTTNPFSFAKLGGAPADATAFDGRGRGIERTTTDFNLRISHQLNDSWAINSVGNYRIYDSYEILDADGSQAAAFELAEDADGNQFSQEIRLPLATSGAAASPPASTWCPARASATATKCSSTSPTSR